MPDTFLDLDALRARGIKFSSSQLRRKMAAGTFPKAVRLGDRTSAWVQREIDAWQAERIAEREAPKAA